MVAFFAELSLEVGFPELVPWSRLTTAVGRAATVKDSAGSVAVSYAVATLCGHGRGRWHGRGIYRQQTMLADCWQYRTSIMGERWYG